MLVLKAILPLDLSSPAAQNVCKMYVISMYVLFPKPCHPRRDGMQNGELRTGALTILKYSFVLVNQIFSRVMVINKQTHKNQSSNIIFCPPIKRIRKMSLYLLHLLAITRRVVDLWCSLKWVSILCPVIDRFGLWLAEPGTVLCGDEMTM